MRTELKIGLFVGMLLIGGGIIFFMSQGQPGQDNADLRPLAENPDTTKTDKQPATANKPAAKPANARRNNTARQSGYNAMRQNPNRSANRTGLPNNKPKATAQRPANKPETLKPVGGNATKTNPNKPATPRNNPWAPKPTPAVKPDPKPAATQPAAAKPKVEPKPVVKPATPKPKPATGILPPLGGDSRPKPKPAARGTKHTIELHDSFWTLAVRYYGDGTLHKKIAEANPDIDPGKLQIGQVVIIPTKEAVVKPEPKPNPRPGDRPGTRKHTYVVEHGDTLSGIATKILGKETRWREIYELNKDKIADPNVLKPGVELKLPAN